MKENGYRRVLLVLPPYGIKAPALPPTGLGYLSEILSKEGIENSIFDFRLGYSVEDFRRRIEEWRPDLVGISMTTYRHDLAYELIDKSKTEDTNFNVVVGGPHITTFRKTVLEDAPKIDFAIKREGEYSLVDLCKGKDLKEIKGLIYRDDGGIVENEDPPYIKNLDSIPFPRYEKAELQRYSKTVPIISSRGCPFQCIFCANGSMGKVYRCRSAQHVAEELKYWYDKGYRNFDFLDDNFTMKKGRVYEICDLIEKYGLRGLEIHSSNGIRADRTNRDLLKRMKEVGWTYVCFGVEAGNNKILQRIKKGETIEQIEEAVKNATELGYEVGLFFMVGHPGETKQDIDDSINFALKYDVAMAKFLNIIPIPGSELFEYIEKNSYFVGDWKEKIRNEMHLDFTPFFQTPELSYEERIEMLHKTRNAWREVMKRHIERKLRKKYGYFGKIAVCIMYFDPLYSLLKKSYNENRAVRRLIDLGIRIMGSPVYHY